jgi:hypothetical protein
VGYKAPVLLQALINIIQVMNPTLPLVQNPVSSTEQPKTPSFRLFVKHGMRRRTGPGEVWTE